MKRVFISLPMNGRTEKQVKRDRQKAFLSVKKIIGEDAVLVDTTVKEDPPEGINPGLWYMGKSLEIMASCDIAYFADEWTQYRGCRIENECAIIYGLEILFSNSSRKEKQSMEKNAQNKSDSKKRAKLNKDTTEVKKIKNEASESFTEASAEKRFVVGEKITARHNLFVNDDHLQRVRYDDLNEDQKKLCHETPQGYAAINPGTTTEVLGEKIVDKADWIQTEVGWICASLPNGNEYISNISNE